MLLQIERAGVCRGLDRFNLDRRRTTCWDGNWSAVLALCRRPSRQPVARMRRLYSTLSGIERAVPSRSGHGRVSIPGQCFLRVALQLQQQPQAAGACRQARYFVDALERLFRFKCGTWKMTLFVGAPSTTKPQWSPEDKVPKQNNRFFFRRKDRTNLIVFQSSQVP